MATPTNKLIGSQHQAREGASSHSVKLAIVADSWCESYSDTLLLESVHPDQLSVHAAHRNRVVVFNRKGYAVTCGQFLRLTVVITNQATSF
jgi:hypothetical protein